MKAKFFISQKITLTAGASALFLGVTDGAYSVEFYPSSIETTAHPLEVSFFESPVVSNNGTPVVPTPSDLKSELTPATLAFSAPTVSNNGSLKKIFPVFADKHLGGSFNNGDPIGLKKGTSYLYEIKNLGNDPTDVYVNFLWTEIQ